MKAVGFQHPLPLHHPDALCDIELDTPSPGPNDLLVRIHAVAVNPVDTKVRASATPEAGQWRVLGWDAVGTIAAIGANVQGFAVGERVYYAGALERQGSNAEFQLVDARLAAHAPQSLADEDAAALPLTALTAWEALFERLEISRPLPDGAPALLIVGAAGGVGSMAVQLARALTPLTIIATASRPESADWVRQLGAHHVIDHRQPLAAQVEALGLGQPGWVFSTTHSDQHWAQIAQLVAAQGKIALIDDPAALDVRLLKRKSISLHWEFMFTRSMFATADLARQGHILQQIADLIDRQQLRSTRRETLGPINAATLRQAHARMESGSAIGKLVLQGFAPAE